MAWSDSNTALAKRRDAGVSAFPPFQKGGQEGGFSTVATTLQSEHIYDTSSVA